VSELPYYFEVIFVKIYKECDYIEGSVGFWNPKVAFNIRVLATERRIINNFTSLKINSILFSNWSHGHVFFCFE